MVSLPIVFLLLAVGVLFLRVEPRRTDALPYVGWVLIIVAMVGLALYLFVGH